jgi:hypothetical protein
MRPLYTRSIAINVAILLLLVYSYVNRWPSSHYPIGVYIEAFVLPVFENPLLTLLIIVSLSLAPLIISTKPNSISERRSRVFLLIWYALLWSLVLLALIIKWEEMFTTE